jgi:hypothetical protein
MNMASVQKIEAYKREASILARKIDAMDRLYEERARVARRAWNYINGMALDAVDKARPYTLREYRYYSSLAIDARKALDSAQARQDYILASIESMRARIAYHCDADAHTAKVR